MEEGSLLSPDGKPVYRPLLFDNGHVATLLNGCVLCVSGYEGVQRDCLVEIGRAMGAL